MHLTKPLLKMSSMSSNNPLETSLELDSHADMTVLGAGTLIMQSCNRPVEVVRYDPQQGSQSFEMVSGVLALDHLQDGQVYHLVFHQAIHMPQLDHHLLCPMQCCINDMTVNDVPKFLTPFPTDNTRGELSYASDRAIFTLAACSQGLHLQAQARGIPQNDQNWCPKTPLGSLHQIGGLDVLSYRQ